MLDDGAGPLRHRSVERRRINIEAHQDDRKWKSDFDLRLHTLGEEVAAIRDTVEELRKAVEALTTIIVIGKGGMAFLIGTAKVTGSISVIGGAIYAIKTWILKV